MRKRWVQIGGELVEVTADYVPDPRSALVMPDIKGYRSMCDGSWVDGRAAHREHLRMHNVIEVGNELDKPKPRKVGPPPGLKQRIIEIANEKLRYS